MLSTKTNRPLWWMIAASTVLFVAGCYGSPMPVNEASPDTAMPSEAPPIDEGNPEQQIRNVVRDKGPTISTSETIGN